MNKREIKRRKLAEADCILFNSKYPVGTEVFLKKDFVDEPVATKTTYPAYVSDSGDAVIFLQGISGYYLLDRVTPVVKSEG